MLVLVLVLGTPVGWGLLVGAGIGVILISAAEGIGTFFVEDYTTTVGRGQISQATWDDAVAAYGQYFTDYLDKVMKAIDLKGQMQEKIETYQLNDVSVKYNPMNKNNVKVLENFMIGAALLLKCQRAVKRITEGRSPEDALKYGIAAYHSVDMNAVNAALGKEGALEFPSEAEFASLGSTRKEHYKYIDTVYSHAQTD